MHQLMFPCIEAQKAFAAYMPIAMPATSGARPPHSVPATSGATARSG